ncbi:MAG: nucleoside hydrolase, partial [Bacteroidota bacterium]
MKSFLASSPIKHGLSGLYLSLSLLLLCCQSPEPVSNKLPLLFDTDFGGDADDLGALAMLNHFHNQAEIDLLGVMCWNTETYAVSAIDAVNTHYGNPDIPIGLRAGETHDTDWNHSKVIADQLPHDATQTNVPEATKLYRQLLSQSADQSLVIVCVGPLMNIKRLLESPSDSISTLNGKELVHSKVKEFVIMGGRFPEGANEWNFDGGMPGVTMDVLSMIDLPITFSGAEVGDNLKTGEVFNELAKDSPLYLGFYHFSQYAPWTKEQFAARIHDNSTFDQTAV